MAHPIVIALSHHIPMKFRLNHHQITIWRFPIVGVSIIYFIFGFSSTNHPAIGVFVYIYISIISYYRRKFRSQTQTSDNMDRWKAETGRVREKRRVEREKIREGKGSAERSSDARKGRKGPKHWVFPMICGSGSRKVGSLKRRLRSHLAKWEMEKCTPLWREAHLQVKKLKAPHVRVTFGSWDVEKVDAFVARSTFRS